MSEGIIPQINPEMDTIDDIDNKNYIAELAVKHGGVNAGLESLPTGNVVNNIIENTYPAIESVIESTKVSSPLPNTVEFDNSLANYAQEVGSKVYEETVNTLTEEAASRLPLLPWENLVETSTAHGVSSAHLENTPSLRDSVIKAAVTTTDATTVRDAGLNAGYKEADTDSNPTYSGIMHLAEKAKQFLGRFGDFTSKINIPTTERWDLRGTPIDKVISPTAKGLAESYDIMSTPIKEAWNETSQDVMNFLHTEIDEHGNKVMVDFPQDK